MKRRRLIRRLDIICTVYRLSAVIISVGERVCLIYLRLMSPSAAYATDRLYPSSFILYCHQGSHAPGKSWIFFRYNFQVLESPGKWVWSWKVLEI